jgi:hypothetical protein
MTPRIRTTEHFRRAGASLILETRGRGLNPVPFVGKDKLLMIEQIGETCDN